jgi:hypothetical protein
VKLAEPWFVNKITYSDLRHSGVSLARSLLTLELTALASPEPVRLARLCEASVIMCHRVYETVHLVNPSFHPSIIPIVTILYVWFISALIEASGPKDFWLFWYFVGMG